ncbi:lysophospholipase L1-like esterase [Rhodococcus sp. 27YEA15]|uniref:GDSL-type esterase/lipase family protein n=1 Tax=Rhodococcus sp. 27YEA15 TaxID=3156259 RepID=UPI003C7C1746
MNFQDNWITTAITEDLLRGALDLERTDRGLLPHRLPARARAQFVDGQIATAEAQPSGVRLSFRTRATALELDTLPTKLVYTGAPPRPQGVYDLLVDNTLTAQATSSGGNVVTVDMATGTAHRETGPVSTVRFTGLPDRVKHVEIWLPHNETTELVELRSDAAVEPTAGDSRRVWLHHGSSISQGSNAAGPSTTWPALAATAADLELVNLGFSGSALLDPFTARTLRDTPADLISIKIGINLVNTDVMRMRAFGPAVHGFLDTVRDGHPTVPLLVVSPVHCPIHEDSPGPVAFDTDALARGEVRFVATGDPTEIAAGKLTLRTIRDELARIVAQRATNDPNLHYLDGLELYGEADVEEHPLTDQLHPDAATHRLIGDRFIERVFDAAGVFTAEPLPNSRR